MIAKYYNNLYEFNDNIRKRKYYELLLSSLKTDMQKWTQSFTSYGKVTYSSPSYAGSIFKIDVLSTIIAYISHSKPPIKDHECELISDSFSSELISAVALLRQTIYTQDIYEIEKEIGNQHSRKEKLEFLEIEQLKDIIEDTYQDWLKNSSEIPAKMIAKIMYAYRKKEEIYNMWLEKFSDSELVMNELTKLE